MRTRISRAEGGGGSCAAVLPGKTAPPVPGLHPGRRGGYEFCRRSLGLRLVAKTLSYNGSTLFRLGCILLLKYLDLDLEFLLYNVNSYHAVVQSNSLKPTEIVSDIRSTDVSDSSRLILINATHYHVLIYLLPTRIC